MVQEAAVSEDFTFPTITDNGSLYHLRFSGFTTSSFWYVSPLPEGGDMGFEQKTHQTRSFSAMEGGRRANNLTRDLGLLYKSHESFNGPCNAGFVGVVDEEKMDMLWEDFNDELSLPSADKKEAGGRPNQNEVFSDSMARYESNEEEKNVGDLCGVQALKVSKSRSLLPHRRPSLLVMLSILKKLFLIHSSHHPRKKTSSQRIMQ